MNKMNETKYPLVFHAMNFTINPFEDHLYPEEELFNDYRGFATDGYHAFYVFGNRSLWFWENKHPDESMPWDTGIFVDDIVYYNNFYVLQNGTLYKLTNETKINITANARYYVFTVDKNTVIWKPSDTPQE